MNISGTFKLEDINETLMREIVFFNIYYPGMGEPGGVIFITASGDEYIISQEGTEWQVSEIVEIFPEIYKAYANLENGTKDEYGFTSIGNWKIVEEFASYFLVRMDYFEKFNSLYQIDSGSNKEISSAIVIARSLFGEELLKTKERMVYKKTQECWDKQKQLEIARKQEREDNRLTDEEVPWMRYKSLITEGYIKFWIRKNDDGTFSGFRWLIQVQKEQCQEGTTVLDAPIECYNLFLQKYHNVNENILDKFEDFYSSYIGYHKAGEFVRSYKTLEKAKEAVCIRNEWIGWGNVDKKNLYMIDYEYLKTQIEADLEIYIY